MEPKSGAQISRKAFLQSFFILLLLMIIAGLLTQVVPAGNYARVEQDGRLIIDPQSFSFTSRPNYPVWRWLSAPVEVLASPDGLTIVVIIVFLLMVGAAFAVLERSGILLAVIGKIVSRFGRRKYLLLALISLFFMLLGAFFGIFEEVVPLIPIMVALSVYMGWDALVGLGMSVLAVNMGFSAAVTNPFTIGVAQKIAGLPLFSGAWLRLVFFVLVYGILVWFLTGYAKNIEKTPENLPVFHEADRDASDQNFFGLQKEPQKDAGLKKSMLWFAMCSLLILLVLVMTPVLPFISEYSLPIVALLFLLGGLGAGFLSGKPSKTIWKAAWDGVLGIAPGILLIMMASSVKFIVVQGMILDTILHSASEALQGATAFRSTLMIYLVAVFIEFFIGSGSAKAFLLMPILLPLGDIAGVTRQIVVTAYCFGEGFTNLIYPTNPVLLIALGLTVVTYPKWLRWTLKLWMLVVPLSLLFLWLAIAIGFGPF